MTHLCSVKIYISLPNISGDEGAELSRPGITITHGDFELCHFCFLWGLDPPICRHCHTKSIA